MDADYSRISAQRSAVRNPLTAALLFVLIGYYVFYCSRVLWISKHVNLKISRNPRHRRLMRGQAEAAIISR